MSSRTAKANKAIADAWEKKSQLVSEGLGTRDWTPEQQQDILERGKAYDDNGKAFEGHHMKSVEAYPEYQGDAENIQFLSRPEHRAAHNGNFQIPTNGYFNPNTGDTQNFGNSIYEPCKIIRLSNPIKRVAAPATELPKDEASHEVNSASIPISQRLNTPDSKGEGTVKKKHGIVIKSAFQSAMDTAGQIYTKHKPLIHGALKLIGFGLAYVGLKAIGESITNGSNENGSSTDSGFDWSSQFDQSSDGTTETIADIEESVSEDAFQKEKRASPAEHTVPGHGQHYWKGGERVWIEKEDYSRGGNKGDE